MSYPATCLLGNRLNAFRLNYVQAALWINIGGGWTGPGTGQDILIESLTINDRLNETPNTLIATVRGTTPIEGQAIRLAIGSQNGALIFAGTILRVTRVWAAQNPRHVLHHIEAIDPTWALNAVLFSARYRNQSATAIAADLLTRAPAGYTGAFEANLPILDEISMTNTTVMDAFVQLARRIGGYTRCDYDAKVYLFKTAPVNPPLSITATHASVADVSLVRDLTQVVTRAVVEGGGSNALSDVPVGASLLPVETAAWYAAGGGFVRSGPQRIAYSGVLAGGAGAFVGAGVTPTTAPTATVGVGTSAVESGAHGYAYTWVTATGETLPSAVATVTVGATPPTPELPQVSLRSNISGSHLGIGSYYQYRVAWSYSTKTPATGGRSDQSAVSQLGPWADIVTTGWGPPPQQPCFNALAYMPAIAPGATYVLFYRWSSLGDYRWVGGRTPAEAKSGDLLDGASESELVTSGVGPHPGANVTLGRATVGGIAPGPPGTTARKVYRTTAGGTQLKLLATIANNTDTALPSFDNTADSALGANAPTTDTAGLILQSKLVNAGETSIPVTSVAPFAPGGGYVLIGNQVVRFGSLGASALLGVPATGAGSLVQSVAWGTAITVAPALVGVSGIIWPILRGDPVNVVVIVDDTGAQTELAAKAGGDGIRESLLQDGRIGIPEAAARGRALLDAQMRPIETVAHRARDYRTRSGDLVAVDLPAPTDIHGEYRIQDVQITNFHARTQTTPPTFTARSSSQRVSFDDLIRQIANTTSPPATGE